MEDTSRAPLRVAIVDEAGFGIDQMLQSADLRLLRTDATEFADVWVVTLACPSHLDAIESIRTGGNGARVVTIASYENGSLGARAIMAGSSAHLAAPLEPGLLATTLRTVACAPAFHSSPVVASRQAEEPAVATPEQVATSNRAVRIAIIDDDALVAQVLARMCERLGASAHVFGSRGEALRSDELASFDLLLCDTRIPDDSVTESELFAALERTNPPTVIAVMSGGYRQVDPNVHFFAKPLDVADIQRLVDLAAERTPRYTAS